MFGFSLIKLLFTIVTVIVVWQGFKWFTRVQENREVGARTRKRQAAESSAATGAKVEEMVKCATCDTFVSPATRSCGRADCPYPG